MCTATKMRPAKRQRVVIASSNSFDAPSLLQLPLPSFTFVPPVVTSTTSTWRRQSPIEIPELLRMVAENCETLFGDDPQLRGRNAFLCSMGQVSSVWYHGTRPLVFKKVYIGTNLLMRKMLLCADFGESDTEWLHLDGEDGTLSPHNVGQILNRLREVQEGPEALKTFILTNYTSFARLDFSVLQHQSLKALTSLTVTNSFFHNSSNRLQLASFELDSLILLNVGTLSHHVQGLARASPKYFKFDFATAARIKGFFELFRKLASSLKDVEYEHAILPELKKLAAIQRTGQDFSEEFTRCDNLESLKVVGSDDLDRFSLEAFAQAMPPLMKSIEITPIDSQSTDPNGCPADGALAYIDDLMQVPNRPKGSPRIEVKLLVDAATQEKIEEEGNLWLLEGMGVDVSVQTIA